jgi:hypothetical protein
MNITVKVKDYGTFNEVFNVTVYANTTAVETREISLTSGASAALTFTWNTSGFAKGNYTLNAYAWPVQGETDTADNTLTFGNVHVGIVGDVNADGMVDVYDLILVSSAFGSSQTKKEWNPNADINNDNIIDIYDLILVASHFGEANS